MCLTNTWDFCGEGGACGVNRLSAEHYAEPSSFTARFSHMELTECRWPAHDGQQPDEI